MKIFAYLHPELNILCCALLPEAVPQGVNAVELEVESTDDIILDNGQIRVKTEQEKLQDKKQELLQKLSNEAKAYIEKYYPELKQRSDVSDKDNGESYLSLQNIDTIQLRKDITDETIKNYPDFTAALDNILIKYQSSTNQLINYWLTQELKSAFRNYFAFLVKQEYYNLETQINNATSEAELPAITFTTIFPEWL
jgi:hypothetical protein